MDVRPSAADLVPFFFLLDQRQCSERSVCAGLTAARQSSSSDPCFSRVGNLH